MHNEGEQNASRRNSTTTTASENTQESQPIEPASENDPLLPT